MISLIKKSLILAFFELKVKNHNTYLGFIWYFLQPLIMFSVLYYVKQNFIDAHIENFVPYLFIGVIMVHFFISSTLLMIEAITKNYELLNSRKIDPEIFLLSKFFVSLIRHIFEAVLVIVILCLLGYFSSVLYILTIPFFSIFIFGLGSILAVISTKFFDITYIWNYFCQLLWFILPIYYLTNFENFLVKYNPISYFLYFGRNFPNKILYCICISVAVFLLGLIVFKSQKENLPERIK